MPKIGGTLRIAGTDISGKVIQVTDYIAQIKTKEGKIYTLPLQAFIFISE
jgi:hypothetical protein